MRSGGSQKGNFYGLRTHHPPGTLVYGYQPRKFIVGCPSFGLSDVFLMIKFGLWFFGKTTKASVIFIASYPYDL